MGVFAGFEFAVNFEGMEAVEEASRAVAVELVVCFPVAAVAEVADADEFDAVALFCCKGAVIN